MKRTKQFIALLLGLVAAVLFASNLSAQGAKTIKGVVIGSDSNSPLSGVIVHLKENAKVFTTTNEKGEYSITVPSGSGTVVFELLGYDTKEIRVQDSFLFTLVTMIIQTNQLDEVIVVGFGTQKKESVVGAVQAVKPENLIVTSSNLTTSFAGNIPGVIAIQKSGEPGFDSATFYIRGRSTFGYNTGALIILDGVEITSSMLNNIPPEAIESMSILKDATATALYGSRGANGVLIITTKEGRNSEKLTINATFDNTFSMPTMIQEIADGVRYMELLNESCYNEARAAGQDYVPYYSDEKIDGTRRKLDPYVFPNNDWYQMMFKDFSMNQRLNVSLRGGGQRVNYFLNSSLFNENGILNKPKETPLDINMNNKKFLFQSNVSAMMTNYTKVSMKLNMQIQYNQTPYESTSDLFYYVMRANPVKFPAVLPAQEGDTYVRYGNNDTWDTGNTDLNPYALLSRGYKDRFYAYTTSILSVDQNLDMIAEGLSAKALVSFYNYSYASTNRYMSPYYFKVNSYSINPDGTYSYTTTQQGDPGNTYLTSSVSHDGYHEWSTQESINYSRKFGRHDVAADLVYHMKERVNNATSADEEQLLPFREQGLAGRITYNFSQRYFFEANFGYNGSENFIAGKRFGFFPSAAIGWTVSNEQFFTPLKDNVSNLKFRASYGKVGNDALSIRFPYLTSVVMGSRAYNFGSNFASKGAGYIGSYGNEEATWEISNKMNVGVDMTLFHDLSISADWFHEHRYNIFMQRQSLAAIAGTATNRPYGNIGEVDNRGVDLSLTCNHVVNNNFTFTLRGTFTYAHNEILAMDEPNYPEQNKHLSKVGHPMNSHRVLVSEGLFTSQEEIEASPRQHFGTYSVGDVKYKDVNDDGVVDANDYVYSDIPSIPEIQYGFGGSVRYHDFDFSVMFQGSGRYQLLMSNFWPFLDASHFGYGITRFVADDHWSWDNNNKYAAFPKLTSTYVNTNNTQASTQYLRKANYLRLKSIELGYSFKKYFRLYVSGSNLFYVSPFRYWDPEKGDGNGLTYPIQRTVRIGLQFTY